MAAIELYSTPLFSDADLKWYSRLESNANDATANANNGSANNMTWVTGKFGDAADFNGSSSYIAIPDSAPTSITGDISISFWIKPDNVTSNARGEIFAKWQSSGSNLSYLIYQKASSGLFKVNMSSDGSSTLATEFETTNRAITTAAFHHVVFVKSGTTATVYVDGEAATDSGQAFPSTIHDSSVAIHIGARNDGGLASYFAGLLDDVAFFSRALTAEEVSNLYNGTFPEASTNNALFFAGD